MADIHALIKRAAKQAGVPEKLFSSLILHGERSYQGWQRSPAGASGPSQLMPGTAAGLASKYGIDPNTTEGNLLGGAYYLKEQLQAFGGNPRKAVAAYNAGPGNVAKYGGVPPFTETKKYVARVLGAAGGGAQPVGYGDLALTDKGNRKIGSVTLGSPASYRIVDPKPPDINALMESSLDMIVHGYKPTDALAQSTPSLLQSWMRPSSLTPVKPSSFKAPLIEPNFGTTQTPHQPLAGAPGAASGPAAPSPKLHGFVPSFGSALNQLIAAVRARGGRLDITSGYRSPELQKTLWDQALKKYGSAAEARKWVAPPGHSNHGRGIAADLRGDLALAHELAPRFGLYFPMSWENWHIEPVGSRG